MSICFFIKTNAQDLKIGNNYFFTEDQISINEDSIKVDGKALKGENIQIKSGHQIRILDIKDKKVYFKYLNFRESKEFKKNKESNPTEEGKYTPFQALYNTNEVTEKTKIFSMPKDDFEKFTKVLYNRFRGFKYGGYTVPIRLRKNDDSFEFNSNISLGANVIARFGLKKKEHMYIDLSLGISITKVDLNSDNSLLGTQGTDFADIETLSPTAFTYTFGVLFNLAENVNLGAYLGWDRLQSSDNKTQWIYNRKPWLGIGLNISAGKADNSTASSSQADND
ncbi:hypothetical protein A9Q86_10415 [Flavobacteriales bacterium 33_180_T64]|nr:hypothetical protein A9Q86_10415 [Flavobacteriales bacterium 33_180_T64]